MVAAGFGGQLCERRWHVRVGCASFLVDAAVFKSLPGGRGPDLNQVFCQWLYAVVLHWITCGAVGFEGVMVCIFFLAVRGAPFSWPKACGGFVTSGSGTKRL